RRFALNEISEIQAGVGTYFPRTTGNSLNRPTALSFDRNWPKTPNQRVLRQNGSILRKSARFCPRKRLFGRFLDFGSSFLSLGNGFLSLGNDFPSLSGRFRTLGKSGPSLRKAFLSAKAYGVRRQAKRDAAFTAQARRAKSTAASRFACRRTPYGTVSAVR